MSDAMSGDLEVLTPEQLDPFAPGGGGGRTVGLPASWSGYDAAMPSERRGVPWWPSLETREALDEFSRKELLRRVRWLAANSGFVRGFIRNAARLVGWWRPTMATGVKEWDEAVNASVRTRLGSRVVFDAGGKCSFAGMQRMLLVKALTDGDLLTVLTEGPSRGARVALYEAHQLRSPREERKKDGPRQWVDGVLVDGMSRHLAYGLSRGEGKEPREVTARDAVYFGQWDSPGEVRPAPPLAHAVNHAIDIIEVWGDVKHAIKTAGVVAAVKELDMGAKARSGAGLPSAVRPVDVGGGQKVLVADVWRGGKVPTLEPGEKMRVLHDARPHPNQRDFVQDLIRDMAVGYGLPPEVIWQMGNLTGPGVRLQMDLAAVWIREWRAALQEWCQRVMVYHVAKEVKAGRLEEPPMDEWMQQIHWTATRDLTIDRGKEGRERREQIHEGLGLKEDFYEDFEGAGFREMTDKRIAEVAYEMEACEKAGVPYERVFPPRQGAARAEDAPEEGARRRGGSDSGEGGE